MNNYDGMIIIGTEINDKGFYDAIKKFESTKVKDFEIDPKLNSTELYKQILEAKKELDRIKKLDIISENDLIQAKDLVNFISQANDRLSQMGKATVIIGGLTDAKNNVEEIKDNSNKIDLSNAKNQFKEISKSTENIVKKIAKWGLALFSIRSAYSFIRRATSLLTESDEQLRADIEYIRWALATAIKPIVEFLVKLSYQLLTYVNFLAKAWFGVDLFAKATTDEFKKQNKEAKKLQKQLAGFDELNVLQSDTGKSSTTPSASLSSGFGDEEAPGWLTTIRDIGQWVLDNWEDVVSMILMTKIIANVLAGNWVGVVIDIVAYMIINLPRLVKAIKNVFDGVVSLVSTIIKLLGDFVVWFYDTIISPIFDFCAWLISGIWQDIQDLAGFILDILKTIFDSFASIVNSIIGIVGSMWDLFVKGGELAWKGITTIFDGLATFFKNIFTGAWEGVKAVFSVGGKIFDGIKEGIVSVFTTIVNGIIGGINKIVAIPFNALNGVLNFIKNIDLPLIGKPFYGFWDYNPIYVPQIPTIPLRTGGIVNYPNQGVPIAGESGREGIIPLTDSQAMEELGQEIGKNVVINATFPVYLGNRQVAREFRRIEARESFATNR